MKATQSPPLPPTPLFIAVYMASTALPSVIISTAPARALVGRRDGIISSSQWKGQVIVVALPYSFTRCKNIAFHFVMIMSVAMIDG